VSSPLCGELRKHEDLDRNNWQAIAGRRMVENRVQLKTQRSGREVINANTAYFNWNAALESDDRSLMFKSLVPDQKVHICRGSYVSVGADGESAGQGVAYTELTQLVRRFHCRLSDLQRDETEDLIEIHKIEWPSRNLSI